MAKARLGDLLVKAGVITESQLRIALAQQRQHGGKLGEHLVRTNLVTEQQLAIAVADQLGLAYNDCRHAHAAQYSKLVPQGLADQLQALPVRFDAQSDTLHVAVADPLDEQVGMALARMTGKRIEMQVAPKSLLRQAIKVAYADIEIHDEGTNEFALVDLAGRESAVVRVGHDDDLPEASVLDLEPVSADLHAGPRVSTPFPLQPGRPTPAQGQRPNAPPAKPAPPPVGASHDAGEEALRLMWAIGDLLIEKGYLSRGELMAKLRSK